MEFALLAPILFLLLFAMVDFGRLFDAWLVSTNAAREGARYAIVYAGQDYLLDSDVEQRTRQRALDYLTGGVGARGDVTLPALDEITVSIPARMPGEAVTVSVPLRVQIWSLFGDMEIFGVPFGIFSNPQTVTGQATMRI